MKDLSLNLLILLIFVMGCGMGNIAKRSSTNFDPYNGSLSELLQSEISGSLVKFKLKGTRDTLADHKDAKEAKAFSYIQEGAGVGIQLDGALINYNSSATANEKLREVAAEVKTTVKTESKGASFTAENGKIVGWTNGSLMCLVKSSAGTKPAGNFKEAAPF